MPQPTALRYFFITLLPELSYVVKVLLRKQTKRIYVGLRKFLTN